MKAAIVNPMRNRKYIEEQFDDIARQKITEWVERNQEPKPPSTEEQLKEAMEGKIIWGKVKKGCSCSSYSHSRGFNIPVWTEIIKTPCQDAYTKSKDAYAELKKKISQSVAAEKKSHYEAVMFSKEDFLDHAKAFRSFKP